MGLPHVLAQLDRQPTLHEPAEHAASLQSGQLPMVTDEHELPPERA
jgi:hypothetical protein